jgi:hypothetical protein
VGFSTDLGQQYLFLISNYQYLILGHFNRSGKLGLWIQTEKFIRKAATSE